MSNILRELLLRPGGILDSATEAPSAKENVDISDAAAEYTARDITLKTVTALHQWAEDDDLGEGETFTDRLESLVIGIADQDKNGEIGDAEWGIVNIALEAAWDFLEEKGIAEADIDLLLNDWDADAGERVRDALIAALPDGEEESMAEIDAFVFSPEDSEAVFDAVYKKSFAVRNGKKIRINKRISGKVRLSGSQKAALRKARMKSHTAAAQLHRMKSLRTRKRAGL